MLRRPTIVMDIALEMQSPHWMIRWRLGSWELGADSCSIAVSDAKTPEKTDKTNMKKNPVEEQNHLPNHHFVRFHVSFQGCKLC